MCSRCTLTVQVLYYIEEGRRRGYTINKEILIKPKTMGMKWQEEKIITTFLQSGVNVRLRVTSECNKCKSQFWAIDNFEQCSENEIRMISAEEDKNQVSCQVIGYAIKPLQYVNTETNTTSVSTSCQNGTFGRKCTKCTTVLGTNKYNCDQSILCDYQVNGQTYCRCPDGYIGESCQDSCSAGFYGNGCKNVCGYCQYTPCNFVNGACAAGQCVNNFSGFDCKTAPLPVLLFAPTVLNVQPTSCKVQLKNTSYTGNGIAAYYKIQYKEEQQKEWNSLQPNFITNFQPIDINGLKPLTTYLVRAVIITENAESYENDFVIPKETFRTNCNFVKENEVGIQTTNISATVTFESNKESCPSADYQVIVRKAKIESETFKFEINRLLPFRNYTLRIINSNTNTSLDLNFSTKEGAPTKVQELRVSNIDDTSITVNWNVPLSPNGVIQFYRVKYVHLRYLSCNKGVSGNQQLQKTLQEYTTSITLINLLPFSQYRLEVMAVTIMDGERSSTVTNTKATVTPLESEILSVTAIEPQSNSARITLQQPNCTLILGPEVCFISVKCSNEWCSQSPLFTNITDLNYEQSVLVEQLLPYSNYKAEIIIGRKGGNVLDGNSLIAPFNTKPTIPNLVKGIVAYSRNESSVSLRFPPPYPPTGVLAEFFVKYCYRESSGWGWTNEICNADYFNLTYCKLWKKLHCVVLNKLKENQLYEISIQAKNNGTNFNDPQKIDVQTIQDAPGAITSLAAVWDNYYNLTLTWDHPSITNGPLTKFIIKIYSNKGVCYEYSYDMNEEKYNLTYSYTIPFVNFCFSSALSIYLSAYNIKMGPAFHLQNLFSPPKTLLFAIEPSVASVTNVTISINLPVIPKLENTGAMYILVSHISDQDNSETFTNNEFVEEIWENSDITKEWNTWIAAEYIFANTLTYPKEFIVGNNTKFDSIRLKKELYNRPLLPSANYAISILLRNEFQDLVRYKSYKVFTSTVGMRTAKITDEANNALFALLLLLLVPVILWIYIRKKKNNKNVTWSNLLSMPNGGSNSTNPDIIPLTTKEETKTVHFKQPTQIKLKQKVTDNPNSSKSSEFSKPIKIIDFENYVKTSIANGELDRQHQLFPRGQTKPWEYGCLPQNKSKNRYNNLVAYDHSRVKLATINNDTYSDYINANYIDGYNTKRAYIATQGPKVTTVNDFWRMIWQEKVGYIVMLANIIEGGKKKSEQYWPNVNEAILYGNIKVEYITSQVFADYEYRTFSVENENEKRRVEQLHFTSWPDHGVPLYCQSLVPFLRKLLTIPQGTAPVVVHCSAGVGRTGTIILCDICLRMAARENVVDILRHQHNMREQRANLVDNIEQYKLAHLVLLECLIAPQTNITCDENMEAAILNLTKTNKLQQHMQYLNDTAWQDQAMQPALHVTPHPEWSKKNRFQDIIPSGYGRVYISRFPISDEHSDYINAIEVDGFRAPERFIATQQPLPHTVCDFWRMIDEKEVTTIVSLNQISKEDQTSCVFWPTEQVNEIQPVPYITLQFQDKSKHEYFTIVTIHLHNNKDKKNEKRTTIHLISLKSWPSTKLEPDNTDSLLKLWEETERLSRSTNPIVVTCYNGATACGLFLALSFVIEKMKLEQVCDVCLAVRTVRHNRKQFVTEKEQFIFLYNAALTYLSCFDLYSNFTSVYRK